MKLKAIVRKLYSSLEQRQILEQHLPIGLRISVAALSFMEEAEKSLMRFLANFPVSPSIYC